MFGGTPSETHPYADRNLAVVILNPVQLTVETNQEERIQSL